MVQEARGSGLGEKVSWRNNQEHGCQMAIAKVLGSRCLALRA